MEINLILGLLVAVASVYLGSPDVRADPMVYLQLNGFILVTGGTIASSLLSSTLREFLNLFKLTKRIVLGANNLKPEEAIKALVRVAELAQKGNKQALIQEGDGKGDGFLKLGLDLVGAGLDKEFIDKTLETKIIEMQRRHQAMITMTRNMGSYAPMFGMAGTVMGVVQVLKNVTDIDNIVSGMALALLTTLYGLFYSSVVFVPISNKLRSMSDSEVLTKEIIREGIWMIMEKEIPLKVEKFLSAYIGKTKQSDKEA